MREHLRTAAERGSARAAILLAGPELPAGAAHVWDWFVRLSRRRGAGFSGPQPIGWSDIDAWCRLTGLRPAPWEIELIELADITWLNVIMAKTYDPPLLQELEGRD